jgi:hypothetical protein
MTPREFILFNSEYYHEAVCNGLDIRMDEEGWLEWMEQYAHFKQGKTRVLFYHDKKHLGSYEFTSIPRQGDTVKLKSKFYHVKYVTYECDTAHEGFNWVEIIVKPI